MRAAILVKDHERLDEEAAKILSEVGSLPSYLRLVSEKLERSIE